MDKNREITRIKREEIRRLKEHLTLLQQRLERYPSALRAIEMEGAQNTRPWGPQTHDCTSTAVGNGFQILIYLDNETKHKLAGERGQIEMIG